MGRHIRRQSPRRKGIAIGSWHGDSEPQTGFDHDVTHHDDLALNAAREFFCDGGIIPILERDRQGAA
jgi:hypothetical protein